MDDMAVIVPEFNIPTACKDCYLSAGYGCAHSGRIMSTKEMEKRAEDCPMKSVDGLIYAIKTVDAWRCRGIGDNKYIRHTDLIKIIREYCGEGKE